MKVNEEKAEKKERPKNWLVDEYLTSLGKMFWQKKKKKKQKRRRVPKKNEAMILNTVCECDMGVGEEECHAMRDDIPWGPAEIGKLSASA